MKKILIGTLIWVLLSCRGGSSESQDGSSCSASQLPSGEAVITCEDGTSGVVEKAPGCQLRPDPAGILINCPPSTEWLLIKNGAQGKSGKDCQVIKSSANNEYLTCDEKKNVTRIATVGVDTSGTCSAIGLGFDTVSGYCRGTSL